MPINYEHALNDNTLVIGGSGTGKTYSFVEPNVLQGNANYIIADAKGSILEDVGQSLKQMGYNIQVLNLVDLKHSMTYNPLANMETALEVRALADEMLVSTASGNQNNHTQDPFWNKAAATLLSALIYFTQEFLPKDEQNMATVLRLFSYLNQDPEDVPTVLKSLGEEHPEVFYYKRTASSDDTNGFSEHEPKLADLIFSWATLAKPNSLTARMWNNAASAQDATRTWASIVSILGASLSAYESPEIKHLLSSNQIDFEQLLKPKTALFIIYDDADPSKNFISNTLYTQLFRFLYHKAFTYKNKQLPVKIRFYLDDFKNILIPNFDDYLATARSRNISVCMMLQDESQLRTKFGSNTSSVIGNCSAYLLTGTTDLIMARQAADRFNRKPEAIRLMDQDHFLLDVGGYIEEPVRYDYLQHPNYVNKPFDINKFIETVDLKTTEKTEGLKDFIENVPEVNVYDDPNSVSGMFEDKYQDDDYNEDNKLDFDDLIDDDYDLPKTGTSDLPW